MELRFAGSEDGAKQHLPSEVKPMEVGENRIRYRTPDPEKHNPKVLKGLAKGGFPVVTLTEVGRSLEEVYLMVVGKEAPAVGHDHD